jgi:hypothetical protein
MAELSGNQIVRLGKRLRDDGEPDIEDLVMLGEVLLTYDRALTEASARLTGIGLEATTRLKTSGTIIDKLRRQRSIDLRHIHDLAGARIVQRMTLDQQDQAAATIVSAFPDSELLDRRERPSFGYRAVHVIARVDGCPIEIQLRTHYQDTWAQAMEFFGDRWGREIRYGGEPNDPDSRDGNPDGPTRRETIEALKRLGNDLHALAGGENTLEQLRVLGADPGRIEELEVRLADAFRLQKDAYDALRRVL